MSSIDMSPHLLTVLEQGENMTVKVCGERSGETVDFEIRLPQNNVSQRWHLCVRNADG